MRTLKFLTVITIFWGSFSLNSVASEPERLNLGQFSVSLNVKDMKKSIDFYERLGFTQILGDSKQWAIMKGETAVIGLFHGLFEGTGLTFNPTDVRVLQGQLKARGIRFQREASDGSGPASAVAVCFRN